MTAGSGMGDNTGKEDDKEVGEGTRIKVSYQRKWDGWKKGQEGFLEIDFKHRQVTLKDGDGDILEVKAASVRRLMLEVGRHTIKGEEVEFERAKAVLQENMELLWRDQGNGPKGGGEES